jgi:hypothetical protein
MAAMHDAFADMQKCWLKSIGIAKCVVHAPFLAAARLACQSGLSGGQLRR